MAKIKFSLITFSLILILIVVLANILFSPKGFTENFILFDVALLCALVGGVLEWK